MTKQTLLKHVWLMIFIANIWVGSWVLLEKCTAYVWWSFPSFLTIGGIGGISLWKIYRIYYYD